MKSLFGCWFAIAAVTDAVFCYRVSACSVNSCWGSYSAILWLSSFNSLSISCRLLPKTSELARLFAASKVFDRFCYATAAPVSLAGS